MVYAVKSNQPDIRMTALSINVVFSPELLKMLLVSIFGFTSIFRVENGEDIPF